MKLCIIAFAGALAAAATASADDLVSFSDAGATDNLGLRGASCAGASRTIEPSWKVPERTTTEVLEMVDLNPDARAMATWDLPAYDRRRRKTTEAPADRPEETVGAVPKNETARRWSACRSNAISSTFDPLGQKPSRP